MPNFLYIANKLVTSGNGSDISPCRCQPEILWPPKIAGTKPECGCAYICAGSNWSTRYGQACCECFAAANSLEGQLAINLPPYIFANYDEANKKVTMSVGDPEIKHQRAMWGNACDMPLERQILTVLTGTMRALVQNSIAGVSEGHICILRLVGVGYRATIENTAITKKAEYEGQKFVSLKLGYAHPVELPVPKGVKATVPQPTRILLEGPDKHDITQFAADIRAWRKPEPYKGKGIFVNDETIRLKAKKIK